MSINIGDKVKFLSETGEAKVVKLLSKSMVIIKDINDFEYQYPINELVVVEKAPQTEVKKDYKETPEIKQHQDKNEPELKENNDSEVLFAFIKNADKEKDCFDCYLVNDSNFHIFYHLILRGENGYEKLDAEILEPNTKIVTNEITRQQINHSKEIIIQMTFFDHPYQVFHNQIERHIKIVPLNFYQEHRFLDNDFFDEKAYIFELLKEKSGSGLGKSIISDKSFEDNIFHKEEVFNETKTEEDAEDKSRRYSPRPKPLQIEVDLHINQLIDSVIGLSNAEIIKIQMDTVHKTLTDAVMNKNVGKVIFIHGIGNGTLKSMLRESLEVQYKLQYEDASFKEYGFGATMVMVNVG